MSFQVRGAGGRLLKPVLSIDEVLGATGDSMRVGTYTVFLNTKVLRFVRSMYEQGQELKCAICGARIAHFRIEYVTTGTEVNHNLVPYGFRKDSDSTLYMPFNRDHIIPQAHGGINLQSNMQLTCITCNEAKGSQLPTTEQILSLITMHANELLEFMQRHTTEVTLHGISTPKGTPKGIITDTLQRLLRDPEMSSKFYDVMRDTIYRKLTKQYLPVIEKSLKQ